MGGWDAIYLQIPIDSYWQVSIRFVYGFALRDMHNNHLRNQHPTSPAAPASPASLPLLPSLPHPSLSLDATNLVPKFAPPAPPVPPAPPASPTSPSPDKKRPCLRLSSLIGLSLFSLGQSPIALAQITPDASLGTESSRVHSNGATDQLDGGAVRGENLFHSFEAFNVGQGRQVYFVNPDGVERIFSRVTGQSRSDILGTLGVSGSADLFLLNPNGVVFGPNARLDVNGSFLVSSGDRIRFSNGFEFSAENPQAPPLLTIQTPIGLQYGANPGPIRVEGAGNNLRINSDGIVQRENRPVGLQAPSGETLALVGGEVSLVGGNLTAAGGRIELGGVAGDSTVTLTPDEHGWRLGYDEVRDFHNVGLSEGASVDASGLEAGAVQVRGRSILLQDGSALLSGTLGSSSGARLTLRAEETIELSGANANGLFSLARADVYPGAAGNAGDLTVETGRLNLRDGARISASTFGEGNSGALTIRAAEAVELSGLDRDGNSSFLLARVNSGATGNAGNITIETGRLILRDGGRVSASVNSQGNGGALTIRATELVELSGADGKGISSRFLTRVNPGAAGNAGDLTIETSRLILRDGALLSASVTGRGQGGDVTIRAREQVELSGVRQSGSSSRINTQVNSGATGAAGDLTIETGRLILRDGGRISASTFGRGNSGALIIRAAESVELSGTDGDGDSSQLQSRVNPAAAGKAGDLTIQTGRLILRDGALVSSSTSGAGDGGALTIWAAESVELSGTDGNGDSSRLRSRVNSAAAGEAGDLTIQTGRLILRDGASISASTSGRGDGGVLTIRAAESVELSGVASDGDSSRIATQVNSNAAGNAGDLTIETGRLIFRDGAFVSASTFGEGHGGNLTVRATDSVELTGREPLPDEDPSRLVTQVNRGAAGNAGNLTIETGRLILQDGALVSASTAGSGNGGTLTINAAESVELSGVSQDGDPSSLRTQVRSGATGNAGALLIETGRLVLQDGGLVLSETEGNGAAGDLTVQAADLVMVADNSILSAQTTGGGEVGKLTVTTDQLVVRDGGELQVSGKGAFPAGTLTVNADTILLLNQARLSAETETGAQGDIVLQAQDIVLRNGGRITTDATGSATGGDITLTLDGSLVLLDNSAIVARAEAGTGGNIRITARGLFLSPDSQIDASSQLGIDGVVNISTPEIDPTQGTVDLPETPVNPQLDQRCQAGGDPSTSRFVSTGRGGLPPSPEGPLSSSGIWEDVRPPVQTDTPTVNGDASGAPGLESILEAQGWRLNQQGEVVLVADAQSERTCGG
ncbi:MAG: S-layer family protein [Leptolyngbyaceae cyanobacterium MO_188.B28]|nr:S-layer family protein [Leptolyngbyaceae cyanobacterium MO_188.B28]